MGRSEDVAVVQLALPSDARYLSLVRIVVGATASVIPSLSDARIADLKLVTTELFTNAMEANWRSAVATAHSQATSIGADRTDETPPCENDRPVPALVRLECRADVLGVTITVTDSGPGLDASGDPHPPVKDPSRLEHERGLGIPLIQYLADEVDYFSGSDGTRATARLTDRDPSPGET